MLAQSARAIAGHGFAEHEVGDLSNGNGPWQALVRVTASCLLDLGEDDLAAIMCHQIGSDEWYVWISEDEQGFVTNESCCNADQMPDQIAVMDRDWESVAAHYADNIFG